MSNDYWFGTKHAVLKQGDVMAAWANKPGLSASNKAFCIWYNGRKTAQEMLTKDAKKYTLLTKSLEDCGRTGWGWGINDLEEAFQHLSKNNGKWIDQKTSPYCYNGLSGVSNGTKGGTFITNTSLPESTRNFLTAVDSALSNMKNAMRIYQKNCAVLNSIKPSPSSPPTDWEKVKKGIDIVKDSAQNVSRYAWLAPATIDALLPQTNLNLARTGRISDFTDGLSTRMNQTVTFFDVVGKIHDSMTLYVEANRAFGDQRVGAAFGALSFALNYLPVLGGFYGEIVKRIPGLVENWKTFIIDYTYRFENPIAWGTSQERQQIPQRCEICGSI